MVIKNNQPKINQNVKDKHLSLLKTVELQISTTQQAKHVIIIHIIHENQK